MESEGVPAFVNLPPSIFSGQVSENLPKKTLTLRDPNAPLHAVAARSWGRPPGESRLRALESEYLILRTCDSFLSTCF